VAVGVKVAVRVGVNVIAIVAVGVTVKGTVVAKVAVSVGVTAMAVGVLIVAVAVGVSVGNGADVGDAVALAVGMSGSITSSGVVGALSLATGSATAVLVNVWPPCAIGKNSEYPCAWSGVCAWIGWAGGNTNPITSNGTSRRVSK
jgi:hypothetical protein